VVSGAYHPPLIEQAQQGLKSELEKTKFDSAKIAVYSNVMAKAVTAPGEIKSLLYKQLTYPVLWTESIQNMVTDGIDTFYEIGPGNVLTGLLKRIDRNVAGNAIGTLEQINSIN